MRGITTSLIILVACLALPEAAITSPGQTGRSLLQQETPRAGVKPLRLRRGRQSTLRRGASPPPARREQPAVAELNEEPLRHAAPAQFWRQEEPHATADGTSLAASVAQESSHQLPQEQQQPGSGSGGVVHAKQNPASGMAVSISLHQQGAERSSSAQVAAGESMPESLPPPPEAAARVPLKRATAAQLGMVLRQVADALESRRQGSGGGTGPVEALDPGAAQGGGDTSNAALPSGQDVTASTAVGDQPPPTQFQARLTYGSGMLSQEDLWAARRDAVKTATIETWAVYEKHAFGCDELRPLSLEGTNNWGNLGMMILDSIDTLYMMGLQPQYQRAALWVANNLSLDHPASLSVFETTIRAVGGLLAIYDLSEDPIFLEKAAAITARLMPAFEGGVLPINTVSLDSRQPAAQPGDRVSLAEFGTLQMEFWTLSRRLSFRELGDLVEAPVKLLGSLYPDRGLLPVDFNRGTGRPLVDSPGAELTMGGNADSYYEYLLKMWILTGKEDDMYRRMWQRAIDEALAQLSSTSQGGLLLIGKRRGSRLEARMEHLTCFLPGNLALGALHGAVATARFPAYMQAAADMTETCWQMYERTATGLAPEEFHVNPDNASEVVSSYMHNLLRPEAVESIFYMWRATKDVKYRRMGWSIFQAFALHSRTPEGAFAKVHNVNQVPTMLGDEMATFWTAETLKYLWLLFGPDEAIDLGSWVFNTEAHPLKVNRTGR